MDQRYVKTVRAGLAACAGLTLLLSGCASGPAKPTGPAVNVAPPVTEASAPQPRRVKRPIDLKPDYPARYVVVKGDTLWDIAARFLKDPWRWPELWQNNPQVANPHLIYPGDVLSLVYIGGVPTLQVERAHPAPVAPTAPTLPQGFKGTEYPTVKLTPKVHVEALAKAVPSMRMDVIRQFLNRPLVLDRDEFAKLPYIFANVDQHLLAGASQKVYARGIDSQNAVYNYAIVRKGKVFVNPKDDDDILGYEAIYVGDAKLVELGDPSVVKLTRTNREVRFGDRLKAGKMSEVDLSFMPHPPSTDVRGQIISVVGGVSQIGQYNIVVLDRGRQAGLEPGNVLAIYQKRGEVRDRIADEEVQLPDVRAGVLMIFRVFDRVSYALVMDATRPIHTMDVVTNP